MAYLNYNYRAKFDQNHTNARNVYRLNSERTVDGSKQTWGVVPLPLAQTMQKDFAGAERIARLSSASVIVKHKDASFDERIHYTDKALFDFFNFPLKYGNLSGFNKSDQIIISPSLADKYFPKQMPVGQSLTLIGADGSNKVYTVIAVTEKIPENSSIQFDIITAFENRIAVGEVQADNWANATRITTFVELKNEQAARLVTANLMPSLAPHNSNHKDWLLEGFSLQPFSDLATSSDIDMSGYVYGSQLNSNPRGVLVIVPVIMSIFILIITCFNFTNVSIAFASGRLKEIGVRKVIGGLRRELVWQFLTENIILCLLASTLGLLFVSLLAPTMIELTGIDLSPDLNKDFGFWIFLLLVPVVSAICSGLYPALYVSSFQPVRILKGKTSLGSSNRFTRFLLLAQFSLSCFALVVGIVMTQNAAFQQKADFGYAINEVAVVQVNNAQEYRALSQAVQSNVEIKSVAGSAQQIGDDSYTSTARTKSGELQAQIAQVGGQEYLNTMGIRVVDGRQFHSGEADTDQSILVNQTFVARSGFKQPIGQQVTLDSANYTIIGVVNDYKEFGLHDIVPPCILRLARPDDYKYVVVRADREKLSKVTKYLQETWHKVASNVPYRAFLQSDLIEKELRMTQAFKSISFFLAIVTLLLSASGLFAQISLNIDKRSKEIGMRKVLGASVLQIIALVNHRFVRILLLSFVVGAVFGYLFTSKFIFRFIFKYHPVAGPGPYIITLLTVILCCVLIIGSKVYNAATANPIERLRAD
ncbi:ABC transporter permease [Dyadobacter fanqingshengii]|uniref:FtsX-like permease family protein n=1 Tax=Dyadobacter fanqingshengii TaxID=2906443 RepID=A0A9X1PDC5_9BACT|nr:FtsX-like permease family protein [Dyadobacter fanqingshengii]MCF0041550.1 FtsX-like permease family protein [Dyadobacter fanqingshengii]USJ36733.1 FtsX-like permease family protein [Dyadobacter fanqingshengii]